MRKRLIAGAIALLACGLVACSNATDAAQQADSDASEPVPEEISAPEAAGEAGGDAAQASAETKAEPAYPELPRLNGMATVEMVVNGGTIAMELDGDNAPITAGNFVDLVERGFYDGIVFHRVVRQPQPFVVQGGDPKGNGTGGFVDPETGQERRIPLEIKQAGAESPTYGSAGVKPPELEHERGVLSMARTQAPNSASSQFFITLAATPFLDGDYAVFGEVTSGMEVVDGIEQGDRIESATVTSGLENLQR